MLIYGMQNNLTRADVLAAPRLLLIPLLVIPCCVVLSLLTGRLMKLPHRQLGVFVMMAAMGNTIFIGLAMCIELFGDIATPYVMLFYLVSSCFTQLIGIPLVRWSAKPAASPCRWCGNSCARRRSFLSFSVSFWSDWTFISRAL